MECREGIRGSYVFRVHAYQIYKKLGYGTGQTGALVIGDHGKNMIPLPHKVHVGDVSAADLLTDEEFQDIIERTKNGGAEIVKHLGTSGYYGPGRAIAYMVEAILNDSRTVISCSVLLNGEYGYSNVTAGVPVILGKNGVKEIVQMTLGTKTREKFKVSVDSIQEGIDILEKNGFFA